MKKLFYAFAFCVMFFTPPAEASVLTVKKTITPEAFILNDDTTVRLSGINAPPEPVFAKKAEEQLNQLTAGKTIAIDSNGKDRHDRIFAQAYVTDKNGNKSWLQAELIKSGYYFVYPMQEAEEKIGELLKIESAVRAQKRGIWAESGYSDIPTEKAESNYGKYSFITGTVLDAAPRGDKTYLNFGKDWRTDFSITVNNRLKRGLKKSGIDLEKIKGKQVRVRGLIEEQNGPMIILHAPEQLEILP